MSGPFNSSRYSRLLEGLEITIRSLVALRTDNDFFRLDPEFYQKKYDEAIGSIRYRDSQQFKDANPIIIHPQEIKREYVDDDGMWFFRTQNLRPLTIERSNDVFISPLDATKLAKNIIRSGDVLVTRTGANFGDCAYYDLPEQPIASSHILIIRNTTIDQAFLAVFLNSRYGRLQIDKGAYGGAQPEVAPYYLRNIWIPVQSSAFCRAIRATLDRATAERVSSAELLSKAEGAVLDQLGLAGWSSPEPLTFQCRAAHAMATARLDAEHFHPRWLALVAEAESHADHTRFIGDIAVKCERGVQPEYADELASEWFPVVNSRHILEGVLDYDGFERADMRWAKTERKAIAAHVKPLDILTYTTGANIGRTAPYLSNDAGLGSNHVNITRISEEDPVYVAAVMNSKIGRWQTEMWKSGSAQPELYPDNIRNFRIPCVSMTQQLAIRRLVEESFLASGRSQELLRRAKRTVEIAIEDTEAAAFKYLKGE